MQMTGVTLTMPHDSDRAATLTVEMTIEDTGGIRTTIGGHMVVDPAGDADTPILRSRDRPAPATTASIPTTD